MVNVRAHDVLALVSLLGEAYDLLRTTDVPLASSRKAATKLIEPAIARMALLKRTDPCYEVIGPVDSQSMG